MRRLTRVLAAGLGLAGLAGLSACSHRHHNDPLAFVPADTPYVAASLKPLDKDTQKALLNRANTQLPAQVAAMRSAAEHLDAEHDTDAANLLRAFATEFDGRTIQQFAAAEGFNLRGRSEIFGLGLSPVARIQLADTGKFNHFVGRLEKAYGHSFQTAKIGKVDYHFAKFGKASLQVLLAVEGKQAVLAMLPADAGKPMLRKALGIDRPQHSLLDSGRLDKLADQRGYMPFSVFYVDFTKLPALLAGAHDPLLKSLLAAKAAHGDTKPWPLPEACRPDLERMAARMPMLSAGYTRLDTHHMNQRIDIDLASDISQAFAGLKVNLPGLGGGLGAPLDIALALPVKDLHQFLAEQAQAVAAKPFTCPALASMNQGFKKLQMQLPKMGMPGVGDLRGLRVSIDSITPDASTGKTRGQGRVLIASNNPQGLLALAQSMLKPLSQLSIKPDGTPVELPAQLTGFLHQPGWLALTDKALAIGVGNGEDTRLSAMLKGDAGDAGALMRMHVDGAMYQKWIKRTLDAADRSIQETAALDPKAAAEAKKQLAQNRKIALSQAAMVRTVSSHVRMDKHGLVFDTKISLK